MSLTLVYQTCRRQPMIGWFFDSLRRQIGELDSTLDIAVIIVDFFKDERPLSLPETDACAILHVAPKPCVWQGPHRLTRENWFAASNSRNTGLCLARDGYIAFVDDLSVLEPGWLLNVRQSMDWNGISLGAYRKVKNLVVKDGLVVSCDAYPGGSDSRWRAGSDAGAVPCNGDMMFGCSFVAPVEALLTVGGFPEICDGLGFEDVIMGQALENAGYPFRYNRNMLTTESEEHHHAEPAFRRECFEKHPNDPTDKGHAVLNLAKGGVKYFDNFYAGGMRKLREEVLAGKPFPVAGCPQHEWHTGKLLSEL